MTTEQCINNLLLINKANCGKFAPEINHAIKCMQTMQNLENWLESTHNSLNPQWQDGFDAGYDQACLRVLRFIEEGE